MKTVIKTKKKVPKYIDGTGALGYQRNSSTVYNQSNGYNNFQVDGSGETITSNNGMSGTGQAGVAAAGMIGGVLGNQIQNTGLNVEKSSDVNKGKAVGGGIVSGAATGAAMGAVAGPWGAAIGGAIGGIAGGIGGSMKANKLKRQLEEQEEKAQRITEFNATQRGIALAGQTNNFQGQSNTGFYKNGVSDKKIINDNGLKLLNGGKQQLSGDMFQAKGAKHSNGGIDVDYDNDNSVDVEIEGDEVVDTTKGRVYSDNIKPDMNTLMSIKSQIGLNLKGTFADVSKKLALHKSKLESKGDSRFAQNTKKIMLDRIDKAEEALFNDQQSKNGNQQGTEEFKDGGKFDSNGNYIEEDGHAQYVYGVPYTSRMNGLTQPIRGINMLTNPVPHGYFEKNSTGNSSFNKDMSQLKMTELKKDYDSFKRKNEVPKFEGGGKNRGFITDTSMTDTNPLDGRYLVGSSIYNNDPETTAKMERKARREENWGDFKDKFNSSLTPENVANFTNFSNPIIGRFADQRAINKLESRVDPSLIEAQPFVFNDTTSARERKNAESARQVLNNINAGSTQTQVAAKAALLANKLRADNDVNISELQRKDQYLGQYRDTEFRRNAINSQTINSVNEDNLNRRNNIVVQQQAANNNFRQGISNAIQAYNINKNEKTKMELITLLLRDPEMYNRMKQSNPELFK